MPEPRRKILIVDDEVDMREFVQIALEEDGYDFVIATNGAAALEKAREEQPDLIVMDVQMPQRDGLSALYELRQDPATEAIPVIFLTGVAEKTGVRFTPETIEEYMGERPEFYLDKPVDPDELRATVRTVLAR